LIDRDFNEGLTLMLKEPLQQHAIVTKAVNIIGSMRNAPTCNQMAIKGLINNCKSLDSSSANVETGTNVVLDQVKVKYAARLAMCELQSAQAAIPKACSILLPSPQACMKGGWGSYFSREEPPEAKFCYPETTGVQFKRCMDVITEKGQYWTSFSNAKQNAVVVCQASRDFLERGTSVAVCCFHYILTQSRIQTCHV
jgi:hypothetical protein